jgi:ribosome-binding factor A
VTLPVASIRANSEYTRNDCAQAADARSKNTAVFTNVLYPEDVDPHRHERVAESLREELEELIGYELADPRVGNASITEVLLSPDFRQAHIRISLHGTPKEQEDTLAGINHAKPFLKRELTDRLQLYRMPELHFEADLPAALAAKAPQILKRIKRGRARPEQGSEKNPIS